jgi:ribonuclease D
MSALPFQMIDSPAGLRELAARLRDAAGVALDTEFVWDRTYYARLGLVQAGLADGTCFLVDAVAVPDLAPLGAVLADGGIEKILHDAPQDLMILRRATGAPARRIFDTRLAAGFAGLGSTLSLANLLAELCGVQLEKAHTRADWVARPLAPEVLDYAADDVRYLPEAAEKLRARAQAAGVAAWLDEELAALDAEPPGEEAAAQEAYLRIRAAASLPPRQLAALRELAAWRECEARAKDLPRRWLLEDGDLVALAAALPQTPDDLRRCRGLKPPAIQRWGGVFLEAIGRALALAEAELPPPVFQAGRDPALKRAVDAALRAIQERAAARGIDPALAGSRTDVARLLRDGAAARPADHALLRGWRAELLGDTLAAGLPKTLF